MDLSTCVSVPPYSFLLGSKLLAILAFSNILSGFFEEKYADPLLGLVASCATGIHAPIFNRIMLAQGGLYRRIGETAGYTTVWASPETIDAARAVVGINCALDIQSLKSKPLIALQKALRLSGVPYRRVLQVGRPKGIYMGTLSLANLDCLRNPDRADENGRTCLTLHRGVEFWNETLLPKRAAHPHTQARLRSFNPNSFRLGAPRTAG